MSKIRIPFRLTLSWSLLLLGCTIVEDNDGRPPVHACDRSYNAHWGAANYRIEHWEPRLCPVDAEPESYVLTGGTIFEMSSLFPDNVTAWAYATAYSEYVINQWWGSFQLGQEYLTFSWGPPCTGCSGNKWQAQFGFEYQRDTNPDFVEVAVTQWGTPNVPKAVLWVHYAGEPE